MIAERSEVAGKAGSTRPEHEQVVGDRFLLSFGLVVTLGRGFTEWMSKDGKGEREVNVLGCTSSSSMFLILGLWNRYNPGDDQGHPDDRLQECEGARIARRNNLALAGVVVAAFMAGAGPQDLEVFGVKASGTMGVLTVCIMVLACHAYWYFMRWHHLSEDAEILVFSVTLNHAPLPFWKEGPRMLRQKSAALFANRACFLLVAASAAISVWWGVDAVVGNVD